MSKVINPGFIRGRRVTPNYSLKRRRSGGIPTWYQNFLDIIEDNGRTPPSETWQEAHISFGEQIAAERALMDVLCVFSTDGDDWSARRNWIDLSTNATNINSNTFTPSRGILTNGVDSDIRLPLIDNKWALNNASYGTKILTINAAIANDGIMGSTGSSGTFLRSGEPGSEQRCQGSHSNSSSLGAFVTSGTPLIAIARESPSTGWVYHSSLGAGSVTFDATSNTTAYPLAVGRRNNGQHTSCYHGFSFYGAALSLSQIANVNNAYETYIKPLIIF